MSLSADEKKKLVQQCMAVFKKLDKEQKGSFPGEELKIFQVPGFKHEDLLASCPVNDDGLVTKKVFLLSLGKIRMGLQETPQDFVGCVKFLLLALDLDKQVRVLFPLMDTEKKNSLSERDVKRATILKAPVGQMLWKDSAKDSNGRVTRLAFAHGAMRMVLRDFDSNWSDHQSQSTKATERARRLLKVFGKSIAKVRQLEAARAKKSGEEKTGGGGAGAASESATDGGGAETTSSSKPEEVPATPSTPKLESLSLPIVKHHIAEEDEHKEVEEKDLGPSSVLPGARTIAAVRDLILGANFTMFETKSATAENEEDDEDDDGLTLWEPLPDDKNTLVSQRTQFVYYRKRDETLYWCDSGSREAIPSQSLKASEVTDVFVGKILPVFSSKMADSKPAESCFSVVCAAPSTDDDEGKEGDSESNKDVQGQRGLHLAASSPEVAHQWCLALQYVLTGEEPAEWAEDDGGELSGPDGPEQSGSDAQDEAESSTNEDGTATELTDTQKEGIQQSMREIPVPAQLDFSVVKSALTDMIKGRVFTRYYAQPVTRAGQQVRMTVRSERVIVYYSGTVDGVRKSSFDSRLGHLYWTPVGVARRFDPKRSFDLDLLKEVGLGKQTRCLRSELARSVREDCALSLKGHSGTRMPTLDLVASSPGHIRMWVTGISYVLSRSKVLLPAEGNTHSSVTSQRSSRLQRSVDERYTVHAKLQDGSAPRAVSSDSQGGSSAGDVEATASSSDLLREAKFRAALESMIAGSIFNTYRLVPSTESNSSSGLSGFQTEVVKSNVFYDPEQQSVFWCSPGTRQESLARSIPLKKLTEIIVGAKCREGTVGAVFRSPQGLRAQDNCIAVLLTPDRGMFVETGSARLLREWLTGLTHLLTTLGHTIVGADDDEDELQSYDQLTKGASGEGSTSTVADQRGRRYFVYGPSMVGLSKRALNGSSSTGDSAGTSEDSKSSQQHRKGGSGGDGEEQPPVPPQPWSVKPPDPLVCLPVMEKGSFFRAFGGDGAREIKMWYDGSGDELFYCNMRLKKRKKGAPANQKPKYVAGSTYSFKLRTLSDLYYGKESALFQKGASGEKADPLCAFSLIGHYKALHVEAPNPDVAQMWLSGLVHVLQTYNLSLVADTMHSSKMSEGKAPVPLEADIAQLTRYHRFSVVAAGSLNTKDRSDPTAQAIQRRREGVTAGRVVKRLALGDVFTRYEICGRIVGQAQAKSSKIKLFLNAAERTFYWCDPDAHRAQDHQNSIKLSDICDIFLGKQAEVFADSAEADDIDGDLCLSIRASTGKSLDLEAPYMDVLKIWLAGLTHLLSSGGQQIVTREEESGGEQKEQGETAPTAKRGRRRFSVVQFKRPAHIPSDPMNTMQGFSKGKGGESKSSMDEEQASKARLQSVTIMAEGTRFRDYKFNDQGDIETRDLRLWYVANSQDPTKPGSLYWCDADLPNKEKRRDEDQSMPLRGLQELFITKQTKELKSEAAKDVEDKACFSIVGKAGDRNVHLHLEAASPEVLCVWLFGINSVLTSNGSQVLLEDGGDGTNVLSADSEIKTDSLRKKRLSVCNVASSLGSSTGKITGFGFGSGPRKKKKAPSNLAPLPEDGEVDDDPSNGPLGSETDKLMGKDVDLSGDAEKAFQLMCRGDVFTMYGLGPVKLDGSPRDVTVRNIELFLDPETNAIHFCDPGTRYERQSSSLQLKMLSDVFIGHNSDVFKHQQVALQSLPAQCFTLVTRNQSLDLEAADQKVLRVWLRGLAYVLRKAGRLISDEGGGNLKAIQAKRGARRFSVMARTAMASLPRPENAVSVLMKGVTCSRWLLLVDGDAVSQQVVLKFKPSSDPNNSGSFQWKAVRRDTAHSVNSGTLPLVRLRELFMGKQTQVFLSRGCQDLVAARCLSLLFMDEFGDKSTLNLEMASSGALTTLINSINGLLSTEGGRVLIDQQNMQGESKMGSPGPASPTSRDSSKRRFSVAAITPTGFEAAFESGRRARRAAKNRTQQKDDFDVNQILAESRQTKPNSPTNGDAVLGAPSKNSGMSKQRISVRIMVNGCTFNVYHRTEKDLILRKLDVFYRQKARSFYWSTPGSRHEDKNCCLPLATITDIYLGKQTPIMKSPIAAKAVSRRCISLVGRNNQLNLEAENTSVLKVWMTGLTHLLNVVTEDEVKQQEAEERARQEEIRRQQARMGGSGGGGGDKTPSNANPLDDDDDDGPTSPKDQGTSLDEVVSDTLKQEQDSNPEGKSTESKSTLRSESVVIAPIEGLLQKKSPRRALGLSGSWQSRFCTLDPKAGFLHYYKTEGDFRSKEEPRGSVSLLAIGKVVNRDGNRFDLWVGVDKKNIRKFKWEASSPQAKAKWLASCEAALQKNKYIFEEAGREWFWDNVK